MLLGSWQWFPIETGRFKLDGGSMFGNVPKVLWERTNPADEFNRIEMAMRSLLLKKDDRVIVIDTGMGHKWSDKQLKMYAVDYSQYTLEKSLKEQGVSFEEVTDVILSHLHFDHTGGSVALVNDKLVPTFPNATYHIQQENLDTAENPNIREKTSYPSENYMPLFDFDCVNILNGECEILPGIFGKMSHGHTTGMQTITIKAEDGSTLNYCADLVPTSAHVTPSYTMGYDIHPVLVIEEKIKFLDQIEKENGILFYEHDPLVAAGYLAKDKRGRHCAGEVLLGA